MRRAWTQLVAMSGCLRTAAWSQIDRFRREAGRSATTRSTADYSPPSFSSTVSGAKSVPTTSTPSSSSSASAFSTYSLL